MEFNEKLQGAPRVATRKAARKQAVMMIPVVWSETLDGSWDAASGCTEARFSCMMPAGFLLKYGFSVSQSFRNFCTIFS